MWPFRDWQWQEGKIQADGQDISVGFRFCPTPASTILQSGDDHGNFLGVAIYREGEELVLVSELEAAWYRYICEWRLHDNGTITPRFGFSAVQDDCVCISHSHHVYWRFDFDIRYALKNAVRQFNSPPIPPWGLPLTASNWRPIRNETMQVRDPRRVTRWEVKNSVTGEGYTIVPGPNDGTADSFARADLWVLTYRPSEIDDGVVATGPPYEAELHKFINGDSIENQDIVIWYAAHFNHHAGAEFSGLPFVGPDLIPSIDKYPIAVSWAGDNIQVFIRGGTNGILHHIWTEPDPWHWNQGGWTSLGRPLSSEGNLLRVVGHPIAVSWAGQNIQVFVRTINNQLYHIWTEPDPWHWNQGGWAALGQQLSFAGDPVAVNWAGNSIQVFARGTDNRLYHMWITGGQ